MATANGADFATQAYSHGVLIGNWHEDQYGCDLLNPSLSSSFAARSPAVAPLAPNPNFLSTTHSSFTAAGHEIVTRGVFEQKAQLRATQEVDRSLLFPHRGAPQTESRYQTSYLSSYGPDMKPRVDLTVAKQPLPSIVPTGDEGRLRSYRTANSDAFNAQNSVLALRADEGAAALRQQTRNGALTQSLEQNYRKMRLRKD